MAKMSFITEKLVEALAWEWQTQEDLYKLLIPMVPPGRALRQYETRAAHNDRAKAGLDRAKPELAESEKIYSGARDLVRSSMNAQLREGGLLERCDLNGEVLIRRRDRRAAAAVVRPGAECEACHRPFLKARETEPRALVIPMSSLITARQRRKERAQ